MPYNLSMLFIESSIFTKSISNYLDDAEYTALQWKLLTDPEAGPIIPGSGGLRKIRWKTKDKGKRGGLRIIYYFKTKAGEIWLLTIYAKNEVSNIPPHILRKIKKEIEL